MKAIPNYSKRTFTIRKENGSKYRTNKMSKSDFDSCLNNTQYDWVNYLKYSNDYSVIR